MGFNTSRVTQGRQAIDAAIRAIRTRGQRARDRRAEIADDPALKAPWAKANLARALAEAEAEDTSAVLADRARGYEAATAVREEIEAYRQYGERPSANAQVAGQRLQRVLDAGVPLADVVHTAIERRDDDALAWLQWAIPDEAARAVAARGGPERATGREVRRSAARLYERVVDARWDYLGAEDRAYHESRRDLARALERLEAHTALGAAEARGDASAITRARYEVGLVDDERWGAMLDAADRADWAEPDAAGPVAEVTATPEPVGA